MKINILLPYKEKFDSDKASSVSITVKNNLFHTKYLKNIKIYGQKVAKPLYKDNFIGFKYSVLSLKSKNSFLAHKMTEIIKISPEEKQLIEIHNRPYLIDHIVNSTNLPVSLFFHNDPQTMTGSKSRREREKLLDKCAAIFCVSEYIKKKFLDGITNNKKNVHVLYNGINNILKRFPLKKKEILFVGRLVPEKGVHHYVDAIKLVALEFPNWEFGLIGSFRLGDNENSSLYATQVIKNFKNVGSQAKFYGFRDHRFVQEKMKTAAIVVIPSTWEEPFGLVVAEAMSKGACVIASKVGGIPEIIKDCGILIEKINHNKLYKKIIYLMKNDKLRHHYQKKSLKNFEFSSKNSSQKLDEFRKIIFKNHF